MLSKMGEEPSSTCAGRGRSAGTVILALFWLLPVGVVLEANMVDPNRAVLWPHLLKRSFADRTPCAPLPGAAALGGDSASEPAAALAPPSCICAPCIGLAPSPACTCTPCAPCAPCTTPPPAPCAPCEAPPPAPCATPPPTPPPAPCAPCAAPPPTPPPAPCAPCAAPPPAPCEPCAAPPPAQGESDLCQGGAAASRDEPPTSRLPFSEGMLALKKELAESLPKSLLLNLIDQRSTKGTCRSFDVKDKFNRYLSYDYGLGYKFSWTAEEIGACIRRLPNKKVLLLGDSRMRNNWFTLKGILFDHRRPEEVWRENHVGDRGTHVLTLPNGDGTIVFRFLKSAAEGQRGFQEHRDADVAVFMSALWDLQKSSNTAGFMLRYIQGLARTVRYVQKKFSGRVLFWGSAPVNDRRLDPASRRGKYLSDSKIEAYNLFAQKLARASGFEWFSPWTFLFTGSSNLGFDVEEIYQDSLHPNGKTQLFETTLLLNEICYTDGFNEGTAQSFVDLTDDCIFSEDDFALITNCSTKAGSERPKGLSRRKRKTRL